MNHTQESRLDREWLAHFRTTLQEQQSDLQRTIQRRDQEGRALSDAEPLDPLDVSASNVLKESLFGQSHENRRRLRLVQRALESIRKGTFGTCAGCEDPISLKRLEAVPWTRFCIQCQEQVELGRLT